MTRPEAESRPCCSISHFMTTFINFPESGEGDKKTDAHSFLMGKPTLAKVAKVIFSLQLSRFQSVGDLTFNKSVVFRPLGVSGFQVCSNQWETFARSE